MVVVQNNYKNTLVAVRRIQTTFVTHSSPSCYVTLRTKVIWVLRKPTWVFLLLSQQGFCLYDHDFNMCISLLHHSICNGPCHYALQ